MKILGVSTIFILLFAVVLSLVLFTTRRSRKFVYIGSYTVLALLLILTTFCAIIFFNYH